MRLEPAVRLGRLLGGQFVSHPQRSRPGRQVGQPGQLVARVQVPEDQTGTR